MMGPLVTRDVAEGVDISVRAVYGSGLKGKEMWCKDAVIVWFDWKKRSFWGTGEGGKEAVKEVTNQSAQPRAIIHVTKGAQTASPGFIPWLPQSISIA